MNEKDISYLATARNMDLEYGDIVGVTTAGIRTTCPRCYNDFILPFNTTLDAWRRLVGLVAELTGVGRRDLLSFGRRPTDEASRARRLLVHALVRVAGESATIQWLTLIGFQPRWVRKELDAELPIDVADWLEDIPRAITAEAEVEGAEDVLGAQDAILDAVDGP